MSARSEEASGAKAQQAQRDEDEHLPFESVTQGNPARQEQRASSTEPKEAGAKRASPQPSPARSAAPPPNGDESAAVLARVEQLVEQRLKPLQQAYDELRAKARSQVETHEAALKKERKKRKQLRKNLESQWWAGGGHIPGWLVPALAAGAPSRVLWVSSGGMYSEPLSVDQLEMSASDYDGTTAYARAKRAQVTLAELWATRLAAKGISVHSMHPGWADTPGVARSLPRFRRVVGPLLRTPADGVDTLVWLAVEDGDVDDTERRLHRRKLCLLYTSDAADE